MRDSYLLALGSGGIGRGLPTMVARHSIWKTRRVRKHPFAIALSRKAAGASLGVFHRSAGVDEATWIGAKPGVLGNPKIC